MIEKIEIEKIKPMYQEKVEELGHLLMCIQGYENEKFLKEVKGISSYFDIVEELYFELEEVYGNKYENMSIKKISPSFEDWLELAYNIIATDLNKRTKDKYIEDVINYWTSFYLEDHLNKAGDYKLKETIFDIYSKDGVAVFTESEIIEHLEGMLVSLER